MTQRLFAACGLAVLLAASPALAQYAPPPPADGSPGDMGPPPGDMSPPRERRPHPPLTRAMAQQMIARGFAMLDTNRDGAITRDEYAAFLDARHAQMMARRAEHDGADAPPPRGDHGPDAPPAGDRGMRGHGPGAMMNGPRWFDMADANRDGHVTLAEAQAGAMAMFDRMDTDRDGVVSAEERRAGMAMMRPHGAPAGRDDMPPPQ